MVLAPLEAVAAPWSAQPNIYVEEETTQVGGGKCFTVCLCKRSHEGERVTGQLSHNTLATAHACNGIWPASKKKKNAVRLPHHAGLTRLCAVNYVDFVLGLHQIKEQGNRVLCSWSCIIIPYHRRSVASLHQLNPNIDDKYNETQDIFAKSLELQPQKDKSPNQKSNHQHQRVNQNTSTKVWFIHKANVLDARGYSELNTLVREQDNSSGPLNRNHHSARTNDTLRLLPLPCVPTTDVVA